jgi:hypothetical protein
MLTKGKCKWPLWRAAKGARLRRIGWHLLRHTFASHLVMRGVPLKAIQELLGHATIEMTMRYSHLAPLASRQTRCGALARLGRLPADGIRWDEQERNGRRRQLRSYRDAQGPPDGYPA